MAPIPKNVGKRKVTEVEWIEKTNRRGNPSLIATPVLDSPPRPSKLARKDSPSLQDSSGNRDDAEGFLPTVNQEEGFYQPRKTKVGNPTAVAITWLPLISLQSQNDYLREWVHVRSEQLEMLLDAEGVKGERICQECRVKPGDIRCLDCFGRGLYCANCALTSHQVHPFHRVEKWQGHCFLRSTLFEEGMVLNLVHQGQECSLSSGHTPRARVEDTIIIVHTPGVAHHRVRYCQCPGAANHYNQLFQHGLFPASFDRPSTAFTFEVLDHFYIEAMQCKTSAQSFFQKLRRLTNNAFPDKVPVSQHLHIQYTCRALNNLFNRTDTGS